MTNRFWYFVVVPRSGKEISKAESLCEQFSMSLASSINDAKKVAGAASVTMSEACLMQLLEEKDLAPLAKRRKLDKEVSHIQASAAMYSPDVEVHAKIMAATTDFLLST
eukprot:6488408-Amphidinium_carterae.1